MTQNILLAGATGMLGSHIARNLLAQPDVHVRLLVRPAADSARLANREKLIAQGAEFVEGDLTDRSSLQRATEGIDVIVSAVQGGPNVIIDGQRALAETGKQNGVRRMLPSDFGMDLFKATPGEHIMFDMRRAAASAIGSAGLEQVHILQGAFMDMFAPGSGTFDFDAGTVTFWGDGTQVIDMTSVESTAQMTAHAAVDRGLLAGKFAFAGDRLSILDAAAIVEAVTGRTFERRSLGNESALRTAKAAAELDHANPFQAVMLAYHLYMLNGQTALSDLQNDRYPAVKLESFAHFATRTLTHPLAA